MKSKNKKENKPNDKETLFKGIDDEYLLNTIIESSLMYLRKNRNPLWNRAWEDLASASSNIKSLIVNNIDEEL